MLDVATAVVALLAPYFAKATESAASKAGEQVEEHVKTLLGAIRSKFSRDQDTYAETTLQRLENQPQDEARQAALRGVLDDKAKSDAAFAEELTRLVQTTIQGQSLNQFLTNVYGGKVGQIVSIGTAGNLTFEK